MAFPPLVRHMPYYYYAYHQHIRKIIKFFFKLQPYTHTYMYINIQNIILLLLLLYMLEAHRCISQSNILYIQYRRHANFSPPRRRRYDFTTFCSVHQTREFMTRKRNEHIKPQTYKITCSLCILNGPSSRRFTTPRVQFSLFFFITTKTKLARNIVNPALINKVQNVL